MDQFKVYSEILFRWIHVIAGVIWIGHLYFFNFVNVQLAKTYDADSKKKVIPELMPRALYWFRWGAMYTWITGVLLLGMVYYMLPANLVSEQGGLSVGAAIGISFVLVIIAFFIYDLIWKSVKNETVGAVISYILVVAVLFAVSRYFVGRAQFIILGGLFGTTMFLNVWMRIWPAQKKIIAGIKGTGPAADAALPALASLRSKHNTYMSVPLLFLMVSNHYPQVYGDDSMAWCYASILVLVGWLITKFLYTKSASAATTSIG